MPLTTPPYVLQETSVQRVMLQVLLALLPGIAVHVAFFGPALLVQMALATLTALLAEGLMLHLRGKPLGLFLSDLSVVVTAWLIALTFPAIAPWWLTVLGTLFAVVVAKQLYGGLGQNPFNPAMVAFAICIVAFPSLISQWPAPGQGFADQLSHIFGGAPMLDGLTAATPLDTLKTGLKLAGDGGQIGHIVAGHPAVFGWVAGRGMEWVALAYLLGDVWLIYRKIITWHIPTAFLAAVALSSLGLWLWEPQSYASPLFHCLAGGTLLGAFFIVTDPVTAATTPRGKLIYAAGAGLLAVIIRVFGAYPDGVAFAVLLMNIAAPLIDMYTTPPIFGQKNRQQR